MQSEAAVLLPWHSRAERGLRAKGVQFFCPSSTYPAIILLVLHFIAQLWSNFHCEGLRMVQFHCKPLVQVLQFPLHPFSMRAEGVQWKLHHPEVLAMEIAP